MNWSMIGAGGQFSPHPWVNSPVQSSQEVHTAVSVHQPWSIQERIGRHLPFPVAARGDACSNSQRGELLLMGDRDDPYRNSLHPVSISVDHHTRHTFSGLM